MRAAPDRKMKSNLYIQLIMIRNSLFQEPQQAQLAGMAHFDNANFFMFCPDEPCVGRVQRFRRYGVAQQMSDGTFDFMAVSKKPQSSLIKKLAHGRVSETKDGAIQLTLKVFAHERINISEAINQEAWLATEAIKAYQSQR